MIQLFLFLSYFLGLSTMLNLEFDGEYYLFGFIILTTIIGLFPKINYRAIIVPVMLATASTMIYALLMGKGETIFIDFIVWALIAWAYTWMADMVMEKARYCKEKNLKIEKYLIPTISQLAVFLIIMMVAQSFINFDYYILINFAIVYVFSRFVENKFDVVFFVVVQSILSYYLLNLTQSINSIEIVLYIILIIINAMIGYVMNKIKK